VAALRTAGQVGEWSAGGPGDKRGGPGRFCAGRQREEAITRAEKRLKRTASKKGREIQPETWEDAKYGMVFSTFSPPWLSTVELLQWDRLRWPGELLFKGLTALAALGHVPAQV
jgi:hypothetical protein